MFTIFLMLATVTFACSACLCVLARRWAPRLGYVDHPGERKIHREPVPYGGGVAVYLSVLAGLAFVGLAAWVYGAVESQVGREGESGALFGQLWAALVSNGGRLPIILGSGTFLLLVGLVDDRWGLSARVKLFAQLAVAYFLFRQGIVITAFLGWWGASLILTVLWIVGLTNAFNFLANMNGLCGGLACVSGAIFFTVAVQTQQFFVAAMLAILVGALIGFLLFNYPKASLFLGDAGSLFVGFLLATLAIEFQFYSSADPVRYRIFPIVLPLLIFAIPIYDVTSVVVLRLRAGESPLKADKRHFSHRLVALGMTPTRAVFTILLLAFAIGITATLLYLLDAHAQSALVMLAQALAILVVIVLLEVSAARRQ